MSNKSDYYCNNRWPSFRVFLALMRRDLLMLRQKITSLIIDSFVIVSIQALIYGYLFPKLGMPATFSAPIFLGTITGFIFFLGYSYSLMIGFDLEHDRKIDYLITLPITKRWLFARYVLYFILESFIVLLPLFLVGFFIPAIQLPIFSFGLIKLFFMLIFILIFFALLFISSVFYYPFDWYLHNLWPRRFSPLFAISAILFPFKAVVALNAWVAVLLLFNPITYCAEGMRSSLFNGEYIPQYICILVLCFFSVLLVKLLAVGIKKRLDPV